MPVRLTVKERHALAELAKPVGKQNYSHVHGHTSSAPTASRAVHSRRQAAPHVPDIFNDLFAKETAMPKTQKKSVDAFRSIEFAETSLHDPIRDRWEEGDDKSGVRLYCTSSPRTHGEENGRWALQIFARVKTKRGGVGKHFAGSTASMSREDLLWLRDQINTALRRKG